MLFTQPAEYPNTAKEAARDQMRCSAFGQKARCESDMADGAAVLSCSVYVDSNSIDGGVPVTPETNGDASASARVDVAVKRDSKYRDMVDGLERKEKSTLKCELQRGKERSCGDDCVSLLGDEYSCVDRHRPHGVGYCRRAFCQGWLPLEFTLQRVFLVLVR